MDRTRNWNNTGSPKTPTSPTTMSPLNRQAASAFNLRRGTNDATKAAAQRLAQVMSHSTDDDDDDDEEEDDFSLDYASVGGRGGLGLGGTGRVATARASAVIHSTYIFTSFSFEHEGTT